MTKLSPSLDSAKHKVGQFSVNKEIAEYPHFLGEIQNKTKTFLDEKIFKCSMETFADLMMLTISNKKVEQGTADADFSVILQKNRNGSFGIVLRRFLNAMGHIPESKVEMIIKIFTSRVESYRAFLPNTEQ